MFDDWDKVKMYDLTQPLSHLTPPWPTYEPLQIKFFKRLTSNGANGQVLTHSNHVGTHLDGEIHFYGAGRDIGSLPLDFLVGPGVVVDISDMAEDYGVYTSKDLEARADIREGDILIIHTGYHHYSWDQPEADEVRYFAKHPGPTREFANWCIKKKIRWIGVDCGSADHPMNTKIREWAPKEAKKCDAYMRAKFGKTLEEMLPDEDYQVMHIALFPKTIIHAENLGGEIDKTLGKRMIIGCFPWKFVGGESCICRIVAFDKK